MTLESLFQKRRARYTKELLKYGRIIFNDHFFLLLFILIGAGGYAYSQYLDTLAMGDMQPRLLLVLLYFLAATSGSITLLLEPADQIFLLPKEEDFKKIFKRLVGQSYLESLLPVALVAFVTFPLLSATMGAQPIDGLFVFLGLASLKGLDVLLKLYPFFETDEAAFQKQRTLLAVVKLAAIIGLVFFNPSITALVVLTLFGYTAYRFFSGTIYFDRLFNWETMITAEENRMQRLYRFIGLFTNVPNIQTNMKRLPWLDGVLDGLSKRNPNASYYYLLRLVARNTEYSMLIIRATLVGALLLAVTESVFISAVLTMLFLYIIGFQLLTLANDLKRVPYFQIYPIAEDEKEEAVYRLIFQILLASTFVLALASLVGVGMIGLGLVLVGVVFAYLFCRFYAPGRLNVGY